MTDPIDVELVDAMPSAGTEATVWFDVQGGDPDRPWLIKRGDVVTRARAVQVGPDGNAQALTSYSPEGFSGLKPSGPRGILLCKEAHGLDEVPV